MFEGHCFFELVKGRGGGGLRTHSFMQLGHGGGDSRWFFSR